MESKILLKAPSFLNKQTIKNRSQAKLFQQAWIYLDIILAISLKIINIAKACVLICL